MSYSFYDNTLMTYVALPCLAPLDRNTCNIVIDSHALTGSDQTEKFFVFSKLTYRETNLASAISIWKVFKRLEEYWMVILENNW